MIKNNHINQELFKTIFSHPDHLNELEKLYFNVHKIPRVIGNIINSYLKLKFFTIEELGIDINFINNKGFDIHAIPLPPSFEPESSDLNVDDKKIITNIENNFPYNIDYILYYRNHYDTDSKIIIIGALKSSMDQYKYQYEFKYKYFLWTTSIDESTCCSNYSGDGGSKIKFIDYHFYVATKLEHIYMCGLNPKERKEWEKNSL
jgi:hypothetical protein